MANITLFGGSHEAIKLVEFCGYSITAIIEPDETKCFPNYKVLRNDSDALIQYPEINAIVAVDNCRDRERVCNYLKKNNINIGNVIGGTLHSEKGKSLFMQVGCFISTNVYLGEGVRLNYGATVMHDCVVSDYVTLAPKSLLLGGVNIGTGSYIGANATILPLVKVGAHCTIGAGSVVTKDIPDNAIVKGVPAKI